MGVDKIKHKYAISIYTSGGFPYGGPAENFVRMMAVGLKQVKIDVNIKLLRGYLKDDNKNDTAIEVKPVLFYYKPSNEFIKILEIIILFFFCPNFYAYG